MWVVCKFFDDGSLFVNTKETAEIMFAYSEEKGQEKEFEILKEFNDYWDANTYRKQMEEVDDKLNKIL